jgi:hypothetical protein
MLELMCQKGCQVSGDVSYVLPKDMRNGPDTCPCVVPLCIHLVSKHFIKKKHNLNSNLSCKLPSLNLRK